MRLSEKSIGKNSVFVFGENILVMFSLFIATAIVARELSVSEFGKLCAALSLMAIISGVAKLGFDTIVVRDASQRNISHDVILGTILPMRLVVSVVLYLAICLILRVSGNGDPAFYVIMAAIIFQSFDVVDLLNQATGRNYATSVIRSVAVVFSSVIRVYLAYRYKNILAVSVGYLVQYIIIAMGFAISAGAESFKRVSWSHIYVKQSYKSAVPLLLSQIMVSIYLNLDQILVFGLMSSVQAGIYSASNRIVSAWYMIPAVLSQLVTPKISRLPPEKQSQEYYLWLRLFSLAGFGICSVITMASPYIVTIVYGGQYAAVIPILRLHIWSVFFILIGALNLTWYVNAKNTKIALYKTVATLSINISLNITLIPRYGAFGAAIAAVSSQLFAGWLSNLVISKQGVELFTLQWKGALNGWTIFTVLGAKGISVLRSRMTK